MNIKRICGFKKVRREMDYQYTNPVIPGFHPDPSICRAGEDYYLVNSSFEYFPGVPIHHSKNMVDWKLVGYCLTEESQLRLERCRPSGGIFAPTIRYYRGEFFMTTTNAVLAEGKWNFIVYTSDIAKGWSQPVRIGQPGIDPSLMFDDDGSVYFTSASNDTHGIPCIVQCTVDAHTGKLLSESRIISYGSGGKNVEGPHLYKIYGRYYLLLAEGGTEHGHMETIFRSDFPYGPFEPCPHNPVLSHRDDMRGDIYCTGHGDLIEDQNGRWWMVCLGTRPCEGINGKRLMIHHLGRETFLAPVVWTEDQWPVIGDHGTIDLHMKGELPTPPSGVNWGFEDHFEGPLHIRYNYLRNPKYENYTIDTERRKLVLKGTGVTISDLDSATWIGIRQMGFAITASVKVQLTGREPGTRVGLTVFHNLDYHYDIFLEKENEGLKAGITKRIHGIEVKNCVWEIPEDASVTLKVCSDRSVYRFFLCQKDGEEIELGDGPAAGICTEGTMTKTYTGAYIALFAEYGTGEFQDFLIREEPVISIKSHLNN